MAPLALVKYSCEKLGKLPKQVDKLDTLINKNIEITRLFKKDISKVIIFKKFVTFNKVIIFKKIPSNILKGYFVIQIYNNKDKNLILMQLLTKLLYNILKMGNYCFAIYYLHYKKKPKITESIYNLFFL